MRDLSVKVILALFIIVFLTFGGSGAGPSRSRATEADGVWIQLSPDSELPIPRGGHSAVWDPQNKRMLIFAGGFGGLNDLWSYDPTINTWTELSPAGTAPSARGGHSAVWDSQNKRMLVFGGGEAETFALLNDLWSYDPALNTWTQLTPTGGPPPGRAEHAAVWDPGNNRMLTFGGQTSGFTSHDDLWSYDPAANTWTELTPTGGPPSSEELGSAEAVWDTQSNGMLVLLILFDVELWLYDPAINTWTQLDPISGGVPSFSGSFHSSAWDEQNHRMVALIPPFVHCLPPGPCDELPPSRLWSYDPVTNEGLSLFAPGGPGKISTHSAIWDPQGKQMLVYGSSASSEELSGLWSFSAAGNRDQDGCTDKQELGSNPSLGGQRDPNNFWDFYDVPVGGSPRDQRVDSFDIGAVVLRFGAFAEPPPTKEEALAQAITPPPDMTSYHAAFDRGGPIPGQNLWNLLPPNGAIDAFDIGAVVVQFGHTCA